MLSTLCKKMEKQFFHWCCEGLKNDIIFQSEEEFIFGMNRIAVCYLHCLNLGKHVQILAFCLLNNHFHFILNGTEEDTALFMGHYRMLTAQWISKHRGERLHGRMNLGHWMATTNESLREKLIYNLRQALEAGLPVTPQGYPWCSAWLMFSYYPPLFSDLKKISEFSKRQVVKMVSSSINMPEDWLVLPNGMIWPECYTDIKAAEKIFRGAGDFLFMLNNSTVDKKTNLEMMPSRPSVPDLEVKDFARKIAKNIYGKTTIGKCSNIERMGIAKILRKELGCGHKQLARIIKMDEEDLRKLV